LIAETKTTRAKAILQRLRDKGETKDGRNLPRVS